METFTLIVIGLVLQVILVLGVWRLASAMDLIAKNYNAECHSMTKAMEEQAVSIKVLAEYLKSKS